MKRILLYLFAAVVSAIYINPIHAQSFTSSDLSGSALKDPTTLQFGPDGRLYVGEQKGTISIYTIAKNGPGDFVATSTEEIELVRNIQNYNDDGTTSSVKNRQVTGILVLGTASNPVIYVSSSDPRIGAGGGATDLDLDTNSGIISRLTWNGSEWEKVDIIRGLPRSEENHASNGMTYDAASNTIYLAQGGHTNAGAPSNNFAFSTEYALAAAILSIDLSAIEAMPILGSGNSSYIYDLPTLDDPDRTGTADLNDPFGGNDGLNQAKLVPGGPVQIYSPGFRNPYDVVLTEAGKMYTIDNGANGGWGGHPDGEGTNVCTNEYLPSEPGSTTPGPGGDPKVNNLDGLHYISGPGYYGGHPHPVRGNPASAGLYTYDNGSGVLRTSTSNPTHPLPADWPPIPSANPVECDFQQAGVDDQTLYTWPTSTNGLTEYTASNFSGELAGDLLTVSFDNNLYRIELSNTGSSVENVTSLGSGSQGIYLDVVAQSDIDLFPGTIWVANYGNNKITIFEPEDTVDCLGTYDPLLDEDNDGYDNADEIDAGSNLCSASSTPPDNDGDFTSDVNDPDDDDDTLDDSVDPFALDADNGLLTSLPLLYQFFNNDPGTGFFGIGFTGVMSDGTSNYSSLLDPDNDLVAGGTSGLFTDPSVAAVSALGTTNTLVNGLQFGFDSNTSNGPYSIRVAINSPFFDGNSPVGNQSQGFYIGTGDQDNYLKLTVADTPDGPGLQVVYETAGTTGKWSYPIPGILQSSSIILILEVNPVAGVVRPAFSSDSGGIVYLGQPIPVGGSLLEAIQGDYFIQSQNTGLAIGLIAESESSSSFAATWDYISIDQLAPETSGSWTNVTPSTLPKKRHENGMIELGGKLYLIGGRGSKPVQIYDPATNTWTDGALPPIELHHIQAVTYNDLIYIIAGYTGSCCSSESGVSNIYIYDPYLDEWSVGADIPASRRRGATGVVWHDNKFYILGGLNGGHGSASTSFEWFDVYDPNTDVWDTLPDAPRKRDHFNAVVYDGKIYAVGGRRSDVPSIQGDEVSEIDVFDLETGAWSTLPTSSNIPTPRAGLSSVIYNGQIFAIGGESPQADAHDEVESFNAETGVWTSNSALLQGRHGTQATILNGEIYITAGNATRGGGDELTSTEKYSGVGGNSAPIALFETDPKIGTPPLTVSFDASESNDLDGFIVSYDWNFGDGTTGSGENVSHEYTLLGTYTATLTVTDNNGNSSSATETISIQETSAFSPLFRVNAGGPAVAAADGSLLEWSEDTKSNPSPYNNSDLASNKTFSSNTPQNLSGPIDPAAPEAIFQSERWDSQSGTEMEWDFPVASGASYVVRLYFSENYAGATGPGNRVFDVAVEGTTLASLDDIDVYAITGDIDTGLMLEVQVEVADDNLDIDFIRNIENPMINGIEILSQQFAQPVAQFTANPPSGPAPLDVTFDASGSSDPDGTIISYTWDFGDGFSGNGETIMHQYTANGNYDVMLTVVDNDGLSTMTMKTIRVKDDVILPPLYRVNAGGSVLVAANGSLPEWSEDSENSPSIYSNVNTANSQTSSTTEGQTVDGTIDPAAPEALFQTHRYDHPSGSDMEWDFPVNPDSIYQIRFYFSENFSSISGPGERTFDVSIDGLIPEELNTLDVFAQTTGLHIGLMVEVEVIADDDNLSIDFIRGTGDPFISGIEVLGSTPSKPMASFTATPLSGDVPLDVSFDASTSSDFDGTISSYDWDFGDGTSASGVTTSHLYESTGVFTATLTVTDNDGNTDSATTTVTVLDPSTLVPLFRVNAGGKTLAAADGSSLDWSKDRRRNPSTYTNASTSGSKIFSSSSPQFLDGSIDPAVPEALFQNDRWDPDSGDEMEWDFPVTSGNTYTVRLYFSENFGGIGGAGNRIFDVEIEGIIPPVLDDVDIFALTGGVNIGLMLETQVLVTDSNLDINFIRNIENPKVNGIEILGPDLSAPAEIISESFSIQAIAYENDLKPNYPNPFVGSTTISFSLAEDNHVRLVVYDILGREIGTITDTFYSAGNHEVNTDLGDVGAGVYLIRMQTDSYQATRQIVKGR